MNKIVLGIFSIIVLALLLQEPLLQYMGSRNIEEPQLPISVGGNIESEVIEEVTTLIEDMVDDLPERTVLAENLTIPWDIVFLDPDQFLVSERDGTIVRIDTEEESVKEIDVPNVTHRGEGGLLGMIADPGFSANGYIYIYRTSTLSESTNASINEVVRYTLRDDVLTDEKIIVGNIPGSLYHNGGRIAFGPDGYLYVATGDARDPDSAQDLDSLAGKILRVTKDGEVPSDNPFDSPIYSYGHRNPQGLTWDEEGRLWSTEHGRTTATLTGMDELNLVVAGGNYGWPDSEGDRVLEGTIGPVIHSGPSITWAPGGATYDDGSIFFGGLRGERLYEAVVDGTSEEVNELREHFVREFGRIRTTLVGPDGGLYLMTSNRDGRGSAADGYDTIVRFNPRIFNN